MFTFNSSNGREELYDRMKDPNETRDRFESEKDTTVLERHREALSRVLEGD